MRARTLKLTIAVATIATFALILPVALACPFCVDQRGPTLSGDFDEAALVLVGRFGKATLADGGGLETGSTKFHVTRVLKNNAVLKQQSVIDLPRYLPNQKKEFVLFCDVFRGLIDPIRGVQIEKNGDLVKYIEGAIKLKGQPNNKRLRYYFDFLNSSDFEVSVDAYREFAKADYADYKDMAKTLPADTIADWLDDDDTPAFRYGLYASLLGICGEKKHGELLAKMLQNPKVRKSSGIDGVLVGYMLILERTKQKEKGLQYLTDILDNPKEEFLMRYAVLRTLRFFWSTRTDVLTKDEIVSAITHTLDHPDIADFGIEDLRKWQRWETHDKVLGLFNQPSHNIRIVKRAILRYALQGQAEKKACREFVAEQRRRDREWVEETEQLLDLETTPAKKSS